MKYLFLFTLTTLLFACKSDSASETTPKSSELLEAQKSYEANPDNVTANTYIDQILRQIGNVSDNPREIVSLSETGLEISEKMNFEPRTRNFLFNLIKEDYGNKSTPSRILNLANQMKKLGRAQTSNILYRSLIENFGSSPEANEAQSAIDPAVSNMDNYLINIGEEIFKGETNKFGINRNAALKYVDACEAYALSFPNSPKTPSYLFRASEIAKSIQTYPKVLSLYDWIINRYPNYEKTPTTLFLKGFVMENDLKNQDKAKEIYTEFLDKYPQHDLVADVKFLLDNLGKTDEEIRQIIEEKQKELKSKEG